MNFFYFYLNQEYIIRIRILLEDQNFNLLFYQTFSYQHIKSSSLKPLSIKCSKVISNRAYLHGKGLVIYKSSSQPTSLALENLLPTSTQPTMPWLALLPCTASMFPLGMHTLACSMAARPWALGGSTRTSSVIHIIEKTIIEVNFAAGKTVGLLSKSSAVRWPRAQV